MFIVRMIALDFQPYEFVENKGFQDLIHHLQPQYKIPHRTTFSRTVIPELYQNTVDSLKAEISSDIAAALESITFITDMWTFRANEGYISLACHYMTQDFTVKAFTLACAPLPENHTAVNIQSCLTEIIKDWSLDPAAAQATQQLKDCQKRMELPSTSLIQDVGMRWNSEHAMVSRLVQLKDAVSLEMATSETSVNCLSASE